MSPGRYPSFSPASTAGRARMIRLTSRRHRLATALAIAAYAFHRPFEKDFLSTSRHPDAKGILDHFQMNVPAAEKVGGVDAFLKFDFEESHLGQARRLTPSEDVDT